MSTAPDELIRTALLQHAAEAPATPHGAAASRAGSGDAHRIAAPPARAWVGGEPAQELHCDICLDVMTQARVRTCGRAHARSLCVLCCARAVRFAVFRRCTFPRSVVLFWRRLCR
jgi:hypothetical protein